ncbi:hypothetical protein [Mesorhizobium album]|uniref:antitoxin VbhA family protein n=1 Tax=Mesorhizobium album TaxID=3072314 RepID=UPI003D3162C5
MPNAKRHDTRLTREEAVVHAIASARIEGVELDEEARSVLGRWAAEELTTQELDEWVEEQVRQATERNQARAGRRAGASA